MLLLSLVWVAAARAETYKRRRMSFAERGKNLVVSTAFTELFDKEAYEGLSSGFPTTVVLRVYTYLNTGDKPVGIRMVRWRSVYDLWDETYIVRVEGMGKTRNFRFSSRVQVLRTLTQLKGFSAAPLRDIDIGPYYFIAMVVQLNPVDLKMVKEMRRWISGSNNASRLDSSSSFFGSFVSVFVNPKLERADRVLQLRSQPFYRASR